MLSEHTLILLRHAKSDWSGDEADADRPLTERGQGQASDAGRWLARSIDGIDLAVVSPANRARSTWELASAELGTRPPTRIDDRVYAAAASELLGVVHTLPDDVGTVVLVGHNPGIENLVLHITGTRVSMPTSALAVVEVAGPWSTAGQSPASLKAFGRTPDDQY
ncbi:MAG: histidine phosphatase family protein [Terrimesophilobacter sp.]